MYLDLNQIGQLLGLDSHNVSPHDQTTVNNVTQMDPTKPGDTFLADLVAFMQDPSNVTQSSVKNGHSLQTSKDVSGQFTSTPRKGVKSLDTLTRSDRIPTDHGVTGLLVNGKDAKTNATPKLKKAGLKKKKGKNISANLSLDTNLDLNSSSSKTNQTVKKRIRNINITTTITKKTKPPPTQVNPKSVNSKKSRLGENGRTILSEPGLGNIATENTVTDIGVHDPLLLADPIPGSQSGLPLSVTDPRNAGIRADVMDTLLDAGFGEGMELFMAMNEILPF